MRIVEQKTGEQGTRYVFDGEKNIFQIMNDKGERLAEIDPLLKLDDEYTLDEYEVKILYNDRDDCTEESIFQVKIESERVGWMFPIQAVQSKEHSYHDNVHFQKYAYLAWAYILNNCEMEIWDFDEFSFFENYDESANFLVLSKGLCSKIDNYKFDNYLVSLFKYGYSEIGKGNLFSSIVEHDKTMRLYAQSLDLEDIPYVIELFKNHIPRETNPISRFYIYYQVIEILIAKVFDSLFVKFVKNLNESTDNLFDKKEELNDYANEKSRVKRLCNNYCKINSDLSKDLCDKCNELLTYVKSVKTGKSMSDSLYLVRCQIVHRMYIIDESAIGILKEIDNMFLDVIIEMVLSFSVPKDEQI